MNKFSFFTFLVFLPLISCKNDNRSEVTRGFYYWKSKFELTDEDHALLKTLKVQKIYVKFFDVNWDELSGQPLPYATIKPIGDIDTSILIVPTVFITNSTFEKLDSYDI
jgi:hypothetical protein